MKDELPHDHLEEEKQTPFAEGVFKKYNQILIGVVLAFIVCMFGFGLYLRASSKHAPSGQTVSTNISNQEPTLPELSPVPSSTPAPTPVVRSNLFSGQIRKLSEDLGLVASQDDFDTGKAKYQIPLVVYYEAGTYTSGTYQGYTRYIAVRSAIDPSGANVFVFASKDKKNFIASVENTYDYDSESAYSSQEGDINKQKVTKTATLDTEFPPTITVNSHFALRKKGAATTRIESGYKDDYGNTIYSDVLRTDFSSYQVLSSPVSNLHLFEDSYFNLPDWSTDVKSFIRGTTQVLVTDSSGFGYTYDLTSGSRIDAFREALQNARAKNQPTYSSVQNPSLRLAKKDIQTTQPIYDTYDTALPRICAFDVNTLVSKDVDPANLNYIGTTEFGIVYSLKDTQHPLLKAAYANKTHFGSNEEYSAFNTLPRPTYDQYVSKNPLLFLQDYWGRWVILGEYDYHIASGCGKPVIYLYPSKPTHVTLQFMSAMHLTTAIPTYHNEWNVLAEPNGVLHDLQPQYTNCNLIDSSKHGSEYAKKACQKNAYPYIYWAGQSVEKSYPKVSGGWIIKQNEVSGFLDSTLTIVGFTQKEKQDFMEYWVPELLSKNSPYYRISFLQTEDMDGIAPMNVQPRPDSTYRLFMDYEPLSSAPSSPLKPQELQHVVRKGFTLVEWGGLKY